MGWTPPKFRNWMVGIHFWKRLVLAPKGSMEQQALNTSWAIWRHTGHRTTDKRVWIGQFMAMLTTVMWGTEEERMGLENIGDMEDGKEKKEKVHKIVKEMCDFVKDYAVQDMRTDLQDMNKYDFLLEVLPDFTQRPWLETLPRGSRIYVARYMLSQHRMPIEVGRWCKLERQERTCTWCRMADTRCGTICQCEPPHKHRCVGSERHYLSYCPCTRSCFMTMAAKVRRKTGIEGEELEDLLAKAKDRTYGQYSVIGRQWSKCCQNIMAVSEKKAVPLTDI